MKGNKPPQRHDQGIEYGDGVEILAPVPQRRSRPAVTVLMPVYNGRRFLCPAIESILNQTFSDFEFVIVDDGSTDDSVEIISSYDDSRIRLLRLTENHGVPGALNYGIQHGRGPLLARMDADDISHPARLERQVAFFCKYPEIALLGTWVTFVDKEGEVQRQMEYPQSHDQIVEQLAEASSFAHPSIMIRAEVIRQCGGYRDFRVAQDYDLWTRVAERYRVANLPEYLLYYRVVPRSHSKTDILRHVRYTQLVSYLYAQRKEGEKDALDGIPFSQQRSWIEGHLHLPPAASDAVLARRFLGPIHELLATGDRFSAFVLWAKALCTLPTNRDILSVGYYAFAPRIVQSPVHHARRILRLLRVHREDAA